MAVRFKRVFGLYTFFSVFLPGSMFILGIAPIVEYVYVDQTGNSLLATVATGNLVTLLGVLVFVTLGLFVGFVLHSLGSYFESKIGGFRLLPTGIEQRIDSGPMTARLGRRHRKQFHEMLNGENTPTHPALIAAIIEGVDDEFQRLDLDLTAPQASSADEDAVSQSHPENPSLRRTADESSPGGERTAGKEGGTTDETAMDGESGDESETINLPDSERDDRSRPSLGTLVTSADEYVRRAVSRIPPNGSEGDAGSDGGETEASADDGAARERSITREEADAVYALVRSRVHMDRSGRSRTFQAVTASCRSALMAWTVLTFLYLFLVGGMGLVQFGLTADELPLPQVLQQVVAWFWIPESPPPALEDLTRAFVAVVFLGFGGAYGLTFALRNNKRYYLEYLVSDYLQIRRSDEDEDDEPGSRTGPVT